jgi:hypothetical protein
LPWITLGKWYDYEWKMYKKIIIPTCLIFVLVISSGVNGRDVAVAILSQIPRGVAVKIVQGLSVVHGMGVIEIDHRYGRYRTAMQDLQRDHISTAVADTAAIAISEIGHRYLGENKTGSFGTLMGYSVAMGGDVIGSPGDDVVAGGYEYSDATQERGMVLVVAEDRSPVRIYGPRQHRAWFGHSVANNGDFDGDGRADVLVGARFANKRSGGVYLITSKLLNSHTDSIEVDLQSEVIEFVVDREEAELGFEVYFGDDWDGDGRSELIMRGHLDGIQSGGIYIVYSSKVPAVNRVDLGEGDCSIQISAGEDYADLGRTIATIGDLDGDGLDELLLGAQAASRYFSADEYVSSRFFVVLSGDLTQQVDMGRDQIFMINEAGEGQHLGSCTGRLGDIDGDSIDDFAVGARYAYDRRGALYIVSGAQLLQRAVKGKQIAIGEIAALTLTGGAVGDVLGWSCAEESADFDGDGIGDIAVGARGADGRVVGAGAVYIVPGHIVRTAIDSGQQKMSIESEGIVKIGGDRHGARLGSKRRFAAAGDFDGDGQADLAIGTPGWHEGGIYAGAVWTISGRSIKGD